jgi:hypothetical protein
MQGLYSDKFPENFEYYSDSYDGEPILKPEGWDHQLEIPW